MAWKVLNFDFIANKKQTFERNKDDSKHNFSRFQPKQDENTEMSLTTMTFCDTNDTAKWIGVQKVNNEESLIRFLGPYLIYLAAATVFTSILYRQKRKRFVLVENLTRLPNKKLPNPSI